MTGRFGDPPNADFPACTPSSRSARWSELAFWLLIGAAAVNHYSLQIFGLKVYPEYIALALNVALITLAARRGLTRLYLPSAMWLLAAWLAVALFASAVNAPDKIHSLILWNKLLFAVLTYAVAANLTRGRSVQAITTQCLIAALVALLGLLIQVIWEFTRIDLGTQTAPNGARVVYGTLWEADIFGSFVTAALLLAVVLVSARSPIPTRRLRTLSGLTILLGAPALIVSASRSAWLALVGALLVAGIFRLGQWLNGPQKIQRALVVSSLTVSVILFSFYAIVPQLDPYEGAFLARRVGSFVDLRGDAALALRVEVLANAITVWKQHPWMGWGVGAYGDMFSMPYSDERGWVSNLFIHQLFDTGLLGLVAFVSAVSVVAWRGLRAWHVVEGVRRSILGGLLLALLGLMIAFQATEASWLAFPWIYLGMLEGATRENTRS
jgi:O-antigen ligase